MKQGGGLVSPRGLGKLVAIVLESSKGLVSVATHVSHQLLVANLHKQISHCNFAHLSLSATRHQVSTVRWLKIEQRISRNP